MATEQHPFVGLLPGQIDQPRNSEEATKSKEFIDSEKTASQKLQDGSKNSTTSNDLAAHNVAASKLGQRSKPSDDPELNAVRGFNFSSSTILRAFIRKVYLILMLQLSVTFAAASFFTFSHEAKLFAWRNTSLMYGCVIGTFVLSITMACCANARRRAPLNYILLAVFTLLTSIVVGFVASVNSGHHVLFAVGITGVIFIALTLFTFQTKYDFTQHQPYLFIGLLVIIIFGWLLFYFPSKTSILVYSALAALLFSFLVIYDTQLILGGKHKYALSPEEYIFAALNLYLDVVNIFLSFLDIFNILSWN